MLAHGAVKTVPCPRRGHLSGYAFRRNSLTVGMGIDLVLGLALANLEEPSVGGAQTAMGALSYVGLFLNSQAPHGRRILLARRSGSR